MARRRRLEAPSAQELAELEQGFATKPGSGGPGLSPPIAQVAGEAAALVALGDAESRAKSASDALAADRLRSAEAEGRLIVTLPLDRIRTEHLSRDRLRTDPEALDELKESIRLHGQRHPVEVVALEEGGYGLISGWRRIKALSLLASETGKAIYGEVRAVVRAADAEAAYTAMVEENEVRSDLTPYERGRVAVVAAGQGAFAGVEAAVNGLFAAASKAKRSKIRSFALVHEELGDLLSFGPDLSEKNGLRLAAALRGGGAAAFRAALAEAEATDAKAEWAALAPVLAEAERAGRPARGSGGRPRRVSEAEGWQLAPDLVLRREVDRDGVVLRLMGEGASPERVETIVAQIRKMFA